jgi:outer membrane protein insertion porin family
MLVALVVLLLAGCAGVKNPPKNVPYVYNNDIVVKSDDLGSEERNLLEEKLLLYLDDSLQVQTVSVLGRTRRINPPVFDSINIGRSIRYMNGYLNSIGYYYAKFDSFKVKKDVRAEKNEIRVSNTFYVRPGKSLIVDTLIHRFRNPVLQQIADSLKATSALNTGAFYSKDKVAGELDRLAGVFRQRGFLRISRSTLLAEADTTDPLLINPNADPVQQLIVAYQRQQNPRISITVFERPGVDSFFYMQYFIDSVFIYPETKPSDEIGMLENDSALQTFYPSDQFLITMREVSFKPKLIQSKNFLVPGQLYNEANYFKTVNGFSQMGPWEQVDSRVTTKLDSVPLANISLYLYPAKKQTFQVDLEGSQNNNISVSNVLAGRFLALAINASHRNRNVFKNGIQSNTSATVGFELNNTQNSSNPNFFQTFIVYLSQSYSLPKLIKPFHFIEDKYKVDVARTNINLSTFYTERFRFFNQTSVNTNLQWEWRKGRNSATFTLPNFETVFIQQFQDSLTKVIQQNPSLQYAFTPGNILSTRMALEKAIPFKRSNFLGFYRIAGELALQPGFKLFNNDFFTFFRLEGQYVNGISFRKSSLHYRGYAGVGWDLSGNKGATLPFFRQFVAGGNNSMRAWGLRQLGLGNSLVSDTASFTDRFGDIQLEVNIEHRFRLFRFFGYPLQGAAFMDIGNIWNHKNNADGSGKLELEHLYRDLAMNMGLGIRWDLSYLVIRLDTGFKLKDPVRDGNGWLDTFEWRSTNRNGTNKRSNLGFQFGIGYPF